MDKIFGFAGLTLLVFAWLPQISDAIRFQYVPVQKSFLIIYATSGVLLTIYSGLVGDVVFILLNALATLEALLCLWVKLTNKKGI